MRASEANRARVSIVTVRDSGGTRASSRASVDCLRPNAPVDSSSTARALRGGGRAGPRFDQRAALLAGNGGALDLQPPLASLGRDRLPAFGRKIVCPVFRTSWLLLLRHYSSVCNGGFEMDVLLTVDGVAERLGTSPRFVRRLVAERRIPFVKVGYHVRVATRDLDAYIAASRVEASGGPKGLRSA